MYKPKLKNELLLKNYLKENDKQNSRYSGSGRSECNRNEFNNFYRNGGDFKDSPIVIINRIYPCKVAQNQQKKGQ